VKVFLGKSEEGCPENHRQVQHDVMSNREVSQKIEKVY